MRNFYVLIFTLLKLETQFFVLYLALMALRHFDVIRDRLTRRLLQRIIACLTTRPKKYQYQSASQTFLYLYLRSQDLNELDDYPFPSCTSMAWHTVF